MFVLEILMNARECQSFSVIDLGLRFEGILAPILRDLALHRFSFLLYFNSGAKLQILEGLGKQYLPLTHVEQVTPLIFTWLHILLIIIALWAK